MKNFLILFVFGFLVNSISAQTECLYQIDSFSSRGVYSITGTMKIVKEEDNKRYLIFEDDLEISSGPDLAIFFLTKNERSVADGNESYLLKDMLKASELKGPQSFEMPSDLVVDSFSYVGIECIGFGNIYWGGGPIETCPVDSTSATAARNLVKDVEGIDIYPVPAVSSLHVVINNPEIESYKVYDMASREISRFDASVDEIFLLDFEPGVYQLVFQLKDGRIHARQFIVQ